MKKQNKLFPTRYKNTIIDKIRTFVKSKIELKKLESLLKKEKLHFSQIDMQNIEYVLQHKEDFDFPPSPPPKEFVPPMKPQDMVDLVLDFYDNLDSEIGNRMRTIYQKYENEIHIYSYPKAEGGYTRDPHKGAETFPDGKQGVCRINYSNDYTTLFSIAHEFMHLLVFGYGKHNEQLAEVHTRFIEHILADYLVDKQIITNKDRHDHFNVIDSQYGKADTLMALKDFQEMLDSNKGRLPSKVLLSYYNGDKNRMYEVITRFNKMLAGDDIAKPRNLLRFVHSGVGSKKLYELYRDNPDKFMKKYRDFFNDTRGIFHKNDYTSFFMDMEKDDIVPNEDNHTADELEKSTEHYK